MKKLLILLLFIATVFGVEAQDKKVEIKTVSASSYHNDYPASKAKDGDVATFWHSDYSFSVATNNSVRVIVTFTEMSHVDYMRYIPRQDGNTNGNWKKVELSYSTNGKEYIPIDTYELGGSSAIYDFIIPDGGVDCEKVQFVIKGGNNNNASAAEIEAYEYDNAKKNAFAEYFEDDLFTVLKPGVTSADGIADADVKALVEKILANADGYKKFRVGEYEPYMTTNTLRNRLKISSQYNNYENPTGIYMKAGESCIVVASGIGEYSVGLKIKNWLVNESSSAYSLRNGLNVITAQTEGNVFVDYYTDEFENAPNVKVHFVNARVLGYWDSETMTNADWKAMLNGRASHDSTIIIARSRHAQLAYPVCAWKQHCPVKIDSLMTLYQQVQWAERDMLGLEKYGRQVKNRQLFYATNYGFMAAGGDGAYCHIGSLGGIMTPDSKNFDFWGVGHEWGHNNQVTAGFKWPGCGETTNNIPASWAQLHFSGNKSWMRLEDENSGIDSYSGMRGGRMQTYFEEGIRKGIAWQLQDGPDYHGTTPSEKSVTGYDADGKSIGTVKTTSRNYDHFVKLVPFWQLNLWGTMAGKSPDIIPMVIEGIRTDANYTSKYNTSGKQQVNWMKLACDSTGLNLLPFFEKAGMLKPVNAYIEDYTPGWLVISDEMIANLKSYVSEKGYPTPKEEINYINAHNYHIYRDKLSLELPAKYGDGCTEMRNGTIQVEHEKVKNAVAFETYDAYGNLTHITMYGLGARFNDHSDTKVLFTGESSYIVAVGYDGTRKMIYGTAKEIKGLEIGKYYNISSKNGGTALTCGNNSLIQLNGEIDWDVDRTKSNPTANACQVWFWEPVDGGFHLKNMQTGLYLSCAVGENVTDLKAVDEATLFEAVCVDEEQGLYAFRLAGSNNYLNAASNYITSIKFGSSTDEDNQWNVKVVEDFKYSIPTSKILPAYYPFAMTIPANVTAYVVTDAGKFTYGGAKYDYAFIEEVEGGVVPAHMPVIYTGGKASYNVTLLPDDKTPHIENNLLRGTGLGRYMASGEYLSSVSATTDAGAIIKMSTDKLSGVESNRSYLLKADVGGVATVYLADKNNVTSIEDVNVDEADIVLYDINGVKVVTPERGGIYVTSSGKKVLVK